MWKKFEDFYKFIASTKFFWEHEIVANFLALTHFLSFWVEFRKLRGVPILGPKL
jgi:hypothetical protein